MLQIRIQISIFCDESGGENGHSKYCLITLVFHDQANSVDKLIADYERAMREKGLDLVPFHTSPCMNGHDEFKNMGIEVRKKRLMHFFIFQRALPYRYKTFAYKRKEVTQPAKFTARLRRDLVVFLADNLEYFQSFDQVKIFYDGGQDMVSKALRAAIDYELSKNAVIYRNVDPRDYYLSQVADFICTMELTAIKFERHELTPTDEKFFGLSSAAFKKLYLRHIRKKAL